SNLPRCLVSALSALEEQGRGLQGPQRHAGDRRRPTPNQMPGTARSGTPWLDLRRVAEEEVADCAGGSVIQSYAQLLRRAWRSWCAVGGAVFGRTAPSTVSILYLCLSSLLSSFYESRTKGELIGHRLMTESYAKSGGGGLGVRDWTFPEEDRAQFTTAPWRGEYR